MPRTGDDAPPVGPTDLGVYLHFPYCDHKCPYCDFNSYAQPFDGAAFARAVSTELRRAAPAFRQPGYGLRTIFFGGGTPSLWSPDWVAQCIDEIKTTLGGEASEVTLETNPGTVDADKLRRFRDAGITRLSFGVQSFWDDELRFLGRIHDAATARAAVAAGRDAGIDVSLDLIYGWEGHSPDRFARSLAIATELGVAHVSAYALTIEPETAFGRAAARGRLAHPSDDAQAHLMDLAADTLEAGGLRRYEVSNFARPGAESLHNLIYWLGGPYLGLGPGAHSYLPAPDLRWARRWSTARSPERYIEDHTAVDFECLDRADALRDRILVGMRTRWGLAPNALWRSVGQTVPPSIHNALQSLRTDGLLTKQSGRFRPTPLGFRLNDLVVRRLLDAMPRDLAPTLDNKSEALA